MGDQEFDDDDLFEFSAADLELATRLEQERTNAPAGPPVSKAPEPAVEADDDADEDGLLTHACETLRRVFGFVAQPSCVFCSALFASVCAF